MIWTYASSNEKPVPKEEVLCDFGMKEHFRVLVYDGNDYFYDPLNKTEYYRLKYDVKRWCHIGEHFDEEF